MRTARHAQIPAKDNQLPLFFPEISSNNHTRTNAHHRTAVGTEMSSDAAASSIEKPAKNRSFTSSALGASSAASFSSASLTASTCSSLPSVATAASSSGV